MKCCLCATKTGECKTYLKIKKKKTLWYMLEECEQGYSAIS